MLSFLDDNRYSSSKFFFRLQKIGWRFMGFWIGSDYITKYQFYFLLFNCIEVLGYGVFQCWYFYVVRTNLVQLLDALTPFATQIPTVIRVIFVVWNRKYMKDILDYLKNAFENVIDPKEKMILGNASRFSYLMLTVLLIFGYLTLFFFCFMPACKDIYQLHAGMDRHYDLPFKADFPFDYHYSPMYEIVYLFSCYSGHITMASVCCGEGLFFGLCAHLSAQFQIISIRLEKLIEREIGDHELRYKLTKEENDKIYKRLSEVMDMHNEAIEKCEILSRTLWQNVLFHFVLSSLIICISCLMIIKSESVEGIVFVFYLCAYTFQIYTYSACGNLLIDSSLRVNDAAYNFHWYKCDARIRKAINLIMIRAQKKVNVEVPFFEVSLETFASVMRLGGSFITLIKTFL